MTQDFEFRTDDRLLVVVPHPDDEVLATGGLIQCALRAGVPVCVVVATDGDNNPWPQRWMERRWRIDAAARRRWGARRRDEARQALMRLGVESGAMHFLGWPDQGLTALLMRDEQTDGVLAAAVDRFSPTVIALPALGDRHPDHSALHVMLEVALRRQSRSGYRRLEYLVHGRACGFALALDADQREGKRLALLAHATQLSLSRRRMQGLCERSERFAATRRVDLPAQTRDLRGRLAAPAGLHRNHRHELLLVLGYANRVDRLRVPLRRGAATMTWTAEPGGSRSVKVGIANVAGGIEVSITSLEPLRFAYAKLERLGHRVLIYDAQGWCDLSALACADSGGKSPEG